MTGRSVRLATIRGIGLHLDLSWLLLAGLVLVNYWTYFSQRGDRDGRAVALMTVAAAVLLFLSIVVHELAHALEAQHRGVTVHRITLFIFGGATESAIDVKRPVDEFALTAVGPLTSFVAAATLGLAATAADAGGWDTGAAVLGPLAWLNVALGVFNLLPGAPLDGGRIVRAAVWKATGDRLRASRVAARCGQALGLGLVAVGLLTFLAGAGAIGALWLVVIGWFLSSAARVELTRAAIEVELVGTTVRDLVPHPQPVLPPTAPLEPAAETLAGGSEVVLVGGPTQVVGVVGPRDLTGTRMRQASSLADVMRPARDLPTINADREAAAAFEALSRGLVLVRDGAKTIGVLTPAHVERHLRSRQLINAVRAGDEGA